MTSGPYTDPEERFLADLVEETKESLIAEIAELRRTLTNRNDEIRCLSLERNRQLRAQTDRRDIRRGIRGAAGFALLATVGMMARETVSLDWAFPIMFVMSIYLMMSSG